MDASKDFKNALVNFFLRKIDLVDIGFLFCRSGRGWWNLELRREVE